MNIPQLPLEEIAAFCERWRITELALFGSALRADFGPDSDLDFLVDFSHDVEWGLFDHVAMQMELQTIVGRDVDLVTRRAVEKSPNRIRREAILNSAHPLVRVHGQAHDEG